MSYEGEKEIMGMIPDYDLLSLAHFFSQFMVLYHLPLLQRNPVV